MEAELKEFWFTVYLLSKGKRYYRKGRAVTTAKLIKAESRAAAKLKINKRFYEIKEE